MGERERGREEKKKRKKGTTVKGGKINRSIHSSGHPRREFFESFSFFFFFYLFYFSWMLDWSRGITCATVFYPMNIYFASVVLGLFL